VQVPLDRVELGLHVRQVVPLEVLHVAHRPWQVATQAPFKEVKP